MVRDYSIDSVKRCMLIAYVRPAYFYNIWFFLMQKVPHPNSILMP